MATYPILTLVRVLLQIALQLRALVEHKLANEEFGLLELAPIGGALLLAEAPRQLRLELEPTSAPARLLLVSIWRQNRAQRAQVPVDGHPQVGHGQAAEFLWVEGFSG